MIYSHFRLDRTRAASIMASWSWQNLAELGFAQPGRVAVDSAARLRHTGVADLAVVAYYGGPETHIV